MMGGRSKNKDGMHARSPLGGGEFALCGLAFDAFESGDEDTPVEFAAAGERVTCAECREVVAHCRTAIGRDWKVRAPATPLNTKED